MSLTTTSQPGGSALVPVNMREAMDLAGMMAKAGFLARELQTTGGALFVIEQSMRWNMSPFAVAMETSFIQNKPMFSGKIVAAAVQASGVLNGRLHYAYTGAGDDRTVTVSGTLRGEATPQTVTVRLGDAKTNNKVWQTQPDQQLAYHGARVWARRHTPEVMLGVYSPEEFPAEEPRNVQAEVMPGGMVDHLRQQKGQPPAEAPQDDGLPLVAPDGREVVLRASASGAPAIVVWSKACERAINILQVPEELTAWVEANRENFVTVAGLGFADDVDAIRGLIEQRMATATDAAA